MKAHDRVHVRPAGIGIGGLKPGYATILEVDLDREPPVRVRYDTGDQAWVWQTWVTVLRPPEVGLETWSTIPTVRLEWLAAVADVAERIAKHRTAGIETYPNAVKRAEGWWMLSDELQALMERKP